MNVDALSLSRNVKLLPPATQCFDTMPQRTAALIATSHMLQEVVESLHGR